MIALLTGKLIHKVPDHLIIDVGGVGYRTLISLQTFYATPEVGSNITLHTFTYVREDQLSLYGFLTLEEKELFRKLINVSGIGPKLAINILSGIPANELVEAVRNEDIVRLNAIPGVGRKMADRIVLDLKDKLLKEHPLFKTDVTPDSAYGNIRIYDDAVSALINLGFTKSDAQKAISKIPKDGEFSLETTIKGALKELIRK